MKVKGALCINSTLFGQRFRQLYRLEYTQIPFQYETTLEVLKIYKYNKFGSICSFVSFIIGSVCRISIFRKKLSVIMPPQYISIFILSISFEQW